MKGRLKCLLATCYFLKHTLIRTRTHIIWLERHYLVYCLRVCCLMVQFFGRIDWYNFLKPCFVLMDVAACGRLCPFIIGQGAGVWKNDVSRGLVNVWKMNATSLSAHISVVVYRCVFSVCWNIYTVHRQNTCYTRVCVLYTEDGYVNILTLCTWRHSRKLVPLTDRLTNWPPDQPPKPPFKAFEWRSSPYVELSKFWIQTLLTTKWFMNWIHRRVGFLSQGSYRCWDVHFAWFQASSTK